MLRSDLPVDPVMDMAMEAVGFRKVEGDVQIVMAQWVPGRGWLHTHRGITVCGEIASQPTGEDAVILAAKTGYRAMQRVLKREEADAIVE